MSRDAVGVVGAGRWGTILAHHVARGGRPALLYTGDAGLAARLNAEHVHPAGFADLGKIAEGVRATADLGEITRACHLVLLAVSASEVRAAIRALGDTLDGSHLVVHAVRGLEPGTLSPPSRIVREETCARKVGALLGPARGDELLAGKPSAAVVASRFPEVIAATQEALADSALRIYSNSDLAGVEAAGAAAGILAVAVGICLELQFGPATLALLVTRGLAEMARLCAAVGGKPETAFGLAGLGDVLVQRESDSRDVRAGRLLAHGLRREAIEAELGSIDAFEAVRTFRDLSLRRGVEARTTAAVHGLLYEGWPMAEALERLKRLEQIPE
jgi:glycerol-3-phosphate dehydrogenase (NAD(P)+)